MDQQSNNHLKEPQTVEQTAKKLKKRMLIIIACLTAFVLVAIPLISWLDGMAFHKNHAGQGTLPSAPIEFYDPDFSYDIMKDPEYLDQNRAINYAEAGITEVLDDKTIQDHGPATIVLVQMIKAIIKGDAETYNSLFSTNFYQNHDPKDEFTMQRVYDITITKVKESTVTTKEGTTYTQYEFDVEYKILKNDGTFRTDIGHRESRKQYFVLSNSTSNRVLIDQIMNYNYQS